MSQEKWFELSEKEKRALLISEATTWCRVNISFVAQGILHPFLLLKRCGYVARLIEPVSKECADLCLLASHAETPDQFKECCEKSADQWNKMLKKMEAEESQRGGMIA